MAWVDSFHTPFHLARAGYIRADNYTTFFDSLQGNLFRLRGYTVALDFFNTLQIVPRQSNWRGISVTSRQSFWRGLEWTGEVLSVPNLLAWVVSFYTPLHLAWNRYIRADKHATFFDSLQGNFIRGIDSLRKYFFIRCGGTF